MTDTGHTTPASTRTSLGGWTLLLALTLTVHAAAVSSVTPLHRPAVVEAVARFLASAHTDQATRDDRSFARSPSGSLIEFADRPVVTSSSFLDPNSALLLERLNLPPPVLA